MGRPSKLSQQLGMARAHPLLGSSRSLNHMFPHASDTEIFNAWVADLHDIVVLLDTSYIFQMLRQLCLFSSQNVIAATHNA